MNSYCPQCGAAMPAGAHFCSKCGAGIATAQPQPVRTMVRPRAGRQIGGVCLALARAYGWDATAVRIVALLGFIFTSGLVGVAYLALWIGIPEETLPPSAAYPPTL